LVIESEQPTTIEQNSNVRPPEVELILSAMDACDAPSWDRRSQARSRFRADARLQLYSDLADASPRALYIRDADARGAGFITQHVLRLAYGGWVTLLTPEGEEVHIECVIYRCRKTVQGWYEGAMRFNRQMLHFNAPGRSAPSPRLRLAD